MFYNNGEFKTLEAGLQLSQLKQNLHVQNISNIDTPNYKAQELSFDAVFEDEQNSDLPHALNARVSEREGSLRPDGNNVDMEYENVELYKTYVQNAMLLKKVKSQFTKFDSVLNSNM